jgi:TonB-dependent SusC/RagA subfamily outer membrane receptor
MKRLLLVALLLFIANAFVVAQTTTISGNITDAVTGKPIPFANVYLNGTTRGTATDEQGQYKLTNISLGTVEIVASFLGYKTTRQPLRLTDNQPKTVSFSLKADENLLNAVTVKAGRDKTWERQRRQFEKYILGEPFGEQCQITNSHVLNFESKGDRMIATATEPLTIVNNALGYTLRYDLQFFDGSARRVYYAGASRLTEIAPADDKQAARFRRNRMRAYLGSTRHLLASLVSGTHEANDFAIYYEDATRARSANNEPPTLNEAITRFKRLIPITLDSLIRPAKLATERRLVARLPLVIFYTKGTSQYSPYRDARYAYSQLVLPNGEMLITTDGLISQPNGMEMMGSLADDRLSTLLPTDWQPDAPTPDQPIITAATFGQRLPTDAVMTQIREAFKAQFENLSPTVFVHIDKPFYATGDRVWLSAYLLDAATNRPTTGETALHLELLKPTGQLVQHQWLRVQDGRARGDFRLSDTLRSGNYRLRAYTDDDETQPGPAFARLVAVYNPTDPAPAESPAGVAALENNPAGMAKLAIGVAVDANSSQLTLQLRPTKSQAGQLVYVLLQQQGSIVSESKTYLPNRETTLTIPTATFPGGLVQVLVYDVQARLLAERLAFLPLHESPIQVRVAMGKDRYQPHEQADLTIRLTDNGQPVVGDVSVSVTDADQVLADVEPGIDTHLLLTGQLRKPLPQANNYFDAILPVNVQKISDLLVHSQWRWVTGSPGALTQVGGMSMLGRVQTAGKKPMPGAYITLASFDAKQPFMRSVQADVQGTFAFRGLSFQDTLSGVVQVLDRDRKKLLPDAVRLLTDAPGGNWLVDSATVTPDWQVLRELLRAARARQEINAASFRDNTARQLEAVTVRGRVTNEADNAVRQLSLHSGADDVIKLGDTGVAYPNVYEMLRGKAAGLSVSGDSFNGYSVSMRGIGSYNSSIQPLYLIDGAPMLDTSPTALLNLVTSDIERIEILKNGSNTAMYGVRGANGVIAFYTKRGHVDLTDKSVPISLRLFGYPSILRQFPVPQRTDETTTQTRPTDRRDVLYWTPQVQTDAMGQTQLTFWLSDVVRTLRVTVQGITADGRLVSGTALVRVQ